MSIGLLCLAWFARSTDAFGATELVRAVHVGELTRTYRVYIPRRCNPCKPAPVVLAFHGAGMNAKSMAEFSGLNEKADEAGFIVVYPNGTGVGNLLLTWHAGGLGQNGADDVAFTRKLLDDLAGVVRIDPKRVYVTGMSNGAMMAYRLAAELSDRVAAIAPVAGTMTWSDCCPERPVPVMHFHGTADRLVPFAGPHRKIGMLLKFCAVEDTVRAWAKRNGCSDEPNSSEILAQDDLRVRKHVYGPGRDAAEVVLYAVEGGGHTWPGRPNPFPLLGETTYSISANDLMWEFFTKHARR